MSKLVGSEIFDVVEKLHKAGLSDAVAIEVIRHNRDYDLSKLATAEQVNSLEVRFNVLETDVAFLKQDVSILKEDVRDLKTTVSLLKQDVEYIKKDICTLATKNEIDVTFEALRTDIAKTTNAIIKRCIVLFATQIVSFVGLILASFLK
jgi:hypothetical protein